MQHKKVKKRSRAFPFYGILITSIFILSSCASSYHPITPDSVQYRPSEMSTNNISISCNYGILKEFGNKKYANHEAKKNLQVLAIKVINGSPSPITIGQDVYFFAGPSMIKPIYPEVAQRKLRQRQAGYLFYLVFTPLNLSVGYQTYPIGIPIGTCLAFGNMSMALSAGVVAAL